MYVYSGVSYMYICICICIHIHTYINIHMYLYTYVYICIYIYTYIYICIYVYLYIYVYIHYMYVYGYKYKFYMFAYMHPCRVGVLELFFLNVSVLKPMALSIWIDVFCFTCRKALTFKDLWIHKHWQDSGLLLFRFLSSIDTHMMIQQTHALDLQEGQSSSVLKMIHIPNALRHFQHSQHTPTHHHANTLQNTPTHVQSKSWSVLKKDAHALKTTSAKIARTTQKPLTLLSKITKVYTCISISIQIERRIERWIVL